MTPVQSEIMPPRSAAHVVFDKRVAERQIRPTIEKLRNPAGHFRGKGALVNWHMSEPGRARVYKRRRGNDERLHDLQYPSTDGASRALASPRALCNSTATSAAPHKAAVLPAKAANPARQCEQALERPHASLRRRKPRRRVVLLNGGPAWNRARAALRPAPAYSPRHRPAMG